MNDDRLDAIKAKYLNEAMNDDTAWMMGIQSAFDVIPWLIDQLEKARAEVKRLRAELVSARKEASTALELVDEALMLAESLGPWTDEALAEHMSIESRRRAAAAGTPEGTHDGV